MEPKLALVYSSHVQGAGPYGVGWDLPIGSVERSTRLGVPLYNDGDTFVLTLPEGRQELVRIAGDVYGARIDEQHFQAVRNRSVNSWIVRFPNGHTYTFGDTSVYTFAQPSVARVARTPGGGFDDTFGWYLTEMRDLNGNTVVFRYATAGEGYLYPEEVRYGGNPGAAFAHPYQVDFDWVLRGAGAPEEAASISYAAGFRRVVTQSINFMSVWFGAQQVRGYHFGRTPSPTNRAPLLTSVTVHGADNQPFPTATRFAYYPTTPLMAPPDDAFAAVREEDLTVAMFRDDDDCKERDFIDMNGDGRADFVRSGSWTDNEPFWKVHLNQGADAPSGALFAAPISWRAPAGCITRHNNPVTWLWEEPKDTATRTTVVDMNGDGRPDYVDSTVYPWHVHLNTGTGFAGGDDWQPDGGETRLRLGGPDGEVVRDLIDLDGDGRPELVSSTPWTATHEYWKVWWNSGDGFAPAEEVPAPRSSLRTGGRNTPDRNIRSDLFDLNGDGLVDVVVAAGTDGPSCPGAIGSGYSWKVWHGTGTGFVGKDAANTPYCWESPPRSTLRSWDSGNEVFRFDVLDINGDGLPDFVDATAWDGTTNPYWQVYANTGERLLPAVPWFAPQRLRKKHPNYDGLMIDTFDVDGNGYPDIVKLPGDEGSDARIWLAHPLPYRPNTLSLVTNPLGGETSLTYAVSSTFNTPDVDPALYDGFPHLPFPVWVVDAVLARAPEAGPDGESLSTYDYSGGYYDPLRREFRGFATVEAVDHYGKTEVTEYHQDAVLQGKRRSVSTYARRDGGLLTRSERTWICSAALPCTPLGDRYFPELKTVAEHSYSSGNGLDVPWTDSSTPRTARTSLVYDACGNVTQERKEDVADPAGALVTVTSYAPTGCDANRVCASSFCDRPSSMEVVGGTRQTMTYDARGNRLTETRVGLGNPTVTRTYDSLGNVATVTDARGMVTQHVYDGATRIYPATTIEDVGGLEHRTDRTFDGRFGQEVSIVDPNGVLTVQRQYDTFGRLEKVVEPGQSMAQSTRRFVYLVGSGVPFQVHELTFEPNRAGYLAKATFYDSLGRPLQTQATTEVQGSEHVVITEARRYEPGGRVEREYAPIAVPGGNATARLPVAPSKPATVFTYDEFGRRIRTEKPDGTATAVSRAQAWTERTCDARHTADASAGQCADIERDGLGREVERRVFHGGGSLPYASQQTFYDAAGRVVMVRQNDDPSTDVETQYDALGRRTAVTHPDAGMSRFTYDGNDNLVFQDDPVAGQHLEMRYDPLNRIEARVQVAGDVQGQGAETVIALYEYDTAVTGIGRLGAVADSSGGTSIESYDARGNILASVKEIDFQGQAKAFRSVHTYDAIGRRRTTRYPYPDANGGETVTFGYSAWGLLTSIGSVQASYIEAVEHDELGRVTRVAFGNGLEDSFGYGDARDGFRLREIMTAVPGFFPLRQLAYEIYDENGNIKAIRDLVNLPGAPESLTQLAEYDNGSRLQRAIQCGAEGYDASFAHDEFGNLEAKDGLPYGYAAGPHQVTSVGGDLLAYDANGNMVELPGDRELTYDAEGRLVEVKRGGVVVGTYLYDHLGQRVAADTAEDGLVFFFDQFDLRGAEVVRHLSGEAGALVSSTVDSQANMFAAASNGVSMQLARQAAGATFLLLVGVSLALPGRRRVALLGRVPRRGIVLVGVVFLAGQLVPLLEMPAAAAIPEPARTLFYHVDHLGTVQLVTDGDGQVVERLVNRPYGELDGVFDPVGQPAGTSRAAFQFTGQRAEDGTGLLYFGARYYDPELGMFITHDSELQFFSPYSYGNGNPLNGTDPSGEQYESSSYSGLYDDEPYDPYELPPPSYASDVLPVLAEIPTSGFLDPVGAEAPEEEEEVDWEEFQRREPGQIYITGHRVLGIGPVHLALEYDNGVGVTWISAGPPEGRLDFGLFGDPVVSGVGTLDNPVRQTDRPEFNTTIGTVSPPVGASPGEYFNSLTAAAASFCGCVDYALFPSNAFDGYNSNSFIAGIVQATGGIPSVPFSRFVGGQLPIPGQYYLIPR
jgi:RHS repeat-associated protein